MELFTGIRVGLRWSLLYLHGQPSQSGRGRTGGFRGGILEQLGGRRILAGIHPRRWRRRSTHKIDHRDG